MALDAGGVDAVFLKAELLEIEGSVVAAEETLLKALDAQPFNGELRARVAGRYLIQHRVDEASNLLSATPTASITRCFTRWKGGFTSLTPTVIATVRVRRTEPFWRTPFVHLRALSHSTANSAWLGLVSLEHNA